MYRIDSTSNRIFKLKEMSFSDLGPSFLRHLRANSHPRLLISAFAITLLSACGGDPAPATTPDPVAPASPVAPISLTYASERPLYVVGEAITPNQATQTGGTQTTFSATPSLPAGLSFDALTGNIVGTPTALQRQITHVVTASNAAGSAQTQVHFTITARGAWSSTPTLAGARHYSSISNLADGRVLVAGGSLSGIATNSAQLYDPVSNTWNAAAPMLSPRVDPMSVVLADGRVLVFGGSATPGNDALTTAELYDPVANTWTATGSTVQSRIRGTAVRLADGKILVAGGHTSSPSLTFRNSVEVYDPATGTWVLLPTLMASTRSQHAAALLPGGSAVLIAGGVNNSGFVTTAEIYAVDGSGSTPVTYGVSGNIHQAVTLDDGSVLFTADGSNQSHRYHPATSAWTTSPLTGTARTLPTFVMLADGRALLAGGSSLNTAEVYNPDVNIWTTATPMARARRAAVAALLADGSVLVVSGFETAGNVDASERYIP